MVVRIKPLRSSVTMLTGLPMLLCVPVRGIANLLMGVAWAVQLPSAVGTSLQSRVGEAPHHGGTEDTEARVPFSLLGTLSVSVVKPTIVVIFR